MTKNRVLEKIAIEKITKNTNFKSDRFCIGVGKRKIYKAYIIYTFKESQEIKDIEVEGIQELKAMVKFLENNGAIIKKLEVTFIS